jgi:hypothetical protein
MRESLSSLETTTQHLALRAAAKAAASCGRRSSASKPLPVSASTNSPMIVILSASPKRVHGSPLRLDPEPGAMLSLSGYPVIGDCISHTNCIPPFAICMKSEVEQ